MPQGLASRTTFSCFLYYLMLSLLQGPAVPLRTGHLSHQKCFWPIRQCRGAKRSREAARAGHCGLGEQGVACRLLQWLSPWSVRQPPWRALRVSTSIVDVQCHPTLPRHHHRQCTTSCQNALQDVCAFPVDCQAWCPGTGYTKALSSRLAFQTMRFHLKILRLRVSLRASSAELLARFGNPGGIGCNWLTSQVRCSPNQPEYHVDKGFDPLIMVSGRCICCPWHLLRNPHLLQFHRHCDRATFMRPDLCCLTQLSQLSEPACLLQQATEGIGAKLVHHH